MEELVFDYAGIAFKVTASINLDGDLEEVLKVEVWDDKSKKYIPIPCHLDKFAKDMQDQLTDAFELNKLAKRLFLEDMAYETAREEGRL